MASGKQEILSDAQFASLDSTDITDAQLRDACLVLLGQAIGVAGADLETLREMLRPVFEAIGAVPYVSWPRGPHGDPRKSIDGEVPPP